MGRLSFSGPYTMPKGASGRVPPTSGGTVSSAPMGAPGGIKYPFRIPRNYGDSYSRGLGYWPGFASSLANMDPYTTTRYSRMADAYLTQFLPDWWYNPGGLFSLTWAKQTNVGNDSYGYDMTGWTRVCNRTVPAGTFPWPKVGRVPTCVNNSCLGGHIGGTLCLGPQGVTIPAGVTRIQFGKGATANPWPDTGGAVEQAWTRATASPAPIVYRPGKIALPMPMHEGQTLEAVATRMEHPQSGSARAAVGLRPGGSTSIDVVLPGDGGSGTVGGGVHNPVPPSRGEKEKKFQLGKGGAAGNVFGAITEFDDFADCLYKAAGGSKPTGLQQKVKYVADNFKIDDPHMVAQAIKCVALSNLEDMAIGKANKLAGRAYGKATGAPRGPGIKRGPAYGTPTRMR